MTFHWVRTPSRALGIRPAGYSMFSGRTQASNSASVT